MSISPATAAPSRLLRLRREAQSAALPCRTSPRELSSTELLAGAREVLIRHGDQCYRLHHTRSGKLILTK
ncbi:MAG: hypothetical protein KatS3mg126_0538 [Lysobacteraceae bacterium]|nr:MAG: hypothetical protein KatS3mg126_0538 [Xanthomonadaceae bacterium]